MKLGIAGFGKMGQDIFNLLFGKLREDRFVILEPYNTEKHAANLQKQLDRKHRRGLLRSSSLQTGNRLSPLRRIPETLSAAIWYWKPSRRRLPPSRRCSPD